MIAQAANIDAVVSAVKALQLVYTFVLAIAIGSAFSEFVEYREGDENEQVPRTLRWRRLFSLTALLLLAVPFIHGMHRYFFDVYLTSNEHPDPYSVYLLIDTIVFTIEAGLIVILSRLLRIIDCRDFVRTIIILLFLNIMWGSFVAWAHTPDVVRWVFLNACTVPLLVAIWWWLGRPKLKKWWLVPSVTLAILALRTFCDYLIRWDFYFPPYK